MGNPSEFQEIKRFEHDLGQCMKCGFCTYWCPVYQEEKVESSVARGKNMIIRGLLEGSLQYTGEYADRINRCTLCMTCTANCPAKTNIPNVIVAARADMFRAKGLSLPYRILYRYILPRRVLFGNILRIASYFQGLFLPRTEGTVRHLPKFLAALGKGRNIPQIAPRFLRQIVPEVKRPPAGIQTRMKIGYFTGCMTDFVFPETGRHIIDFLTRNGVEVIVPAGQGCCGAPVFLGAGDYETGRKLADANVKAFEGLDYIVTDCATCASSLVDYKTFLANSAGRLASYTEFGEKVKDISQFLVDVLKLPASAYQAAPSLEGKKVTWHDPCHLVRHLGIKDQPRQILKSIPGIEYVEMPDADRCCGMAGSFSLHYYDLSSKIADKKVEAIKSTGAGIVATGCPGCEIQLIDSLIRHGVPAQVRHIMELIK